MKRNDERYMRMAIRLARKGAGRPSCEPLVGAVVVAGDSVVGRGFSAARLKGPAVVSAIKQAGSRAEGATVYTNAELCFETAQLNDCLAQLREARPARVVIGAVVAGASDGQAPDLAGTGIEVITGVCELECREANEKYYKYSSTGLPFVTVKFAETLDGRIATVTGDSKWISSPASLRLAHQLRREHDAIMVGIGTVLTDDPQLTVRLVDGRDPLRVIIDSRLRVPIEARVVREGAAHRTLIATTPQADHQRIRELEQLGAQTLLLPPEANSTGVNLLELLKALGERRIASVLVEGGAGIITSLLAAGLVDRLVVAIAPKIVGRGTEAIGDLGITRLSDAMTFASVKTRRLGSDIIFDGRLATDFKAEQEDEHA